jgi:hypothetical protein
MASLCPLANQVRTLGKQAQFSKGGPRSDISRREDMWNYDHTSKWTADDVHFAK